MTTRNAIALAGLMLAFAILSPASALADADGCRWLVQLNSTGNGQAQRSDAELDAGGTTVGTHTRSGSVHFDNGQA